MDGGTVYKQKLIKTKLQIGKRGQKTKLNERSPSKRRRSALDCSAMKKKKYLVYLFLLQLQGVIFIVIF